MPTYRFRIGDVAECDRRVYRPGYAKEAENLPGIADWLFPLIHPKQSLTIETTNKLCAAFIQGFLFEAGVFYAEWAIIPSAQGDDILTPIRPRCSLC